MEQNKEIVKLYVKNKKMECILIYIHCLVALAVVSLILIFLKSEFLHVPYIAVFAMMLLVHIKQRILEYRVDKGYFGSNDYEVLELIEFAKEILK